MNNVQFESKPQTTHSEPSRLPSGWNSNSRNVILVFTLVLLFALGCRLWHIDWHGVNGDEYSSVMVANGLRSTAMAKAFPQLSWLKPNDHLTLSTFDQRDFRKSARLKDVVASSLYNDGGNGILYSTMLHFWARIFGSADVMVRLMSTAFGVASVALVFAFARQMRLPLSISFFAMVLAAAHPALIYYSQICRTYAATTFFVLLSTFYFYRLHKASSPRKTDALGYCLATAAALLSHYLCSYVILGQIIFAAIVERRKNFWLACIGAGTGVAAIVGTWLLSRGLSGLTLLQAQNARLIGLMHAHDPRYTWVRPFDLSGVADGWWAQLRLLFGLFSVIAPPPPAVSLAIGISVALFCVSVLVLAVVTRRDSLKPILLLTCAAFVIPVVATVLSAKSQHCLTLIDRYAVFSTPYVILLTAVLLSKTPRVLAFGATLLMVLLFMQSTKALFLAPPVQNKYATAASVIQLEYKHGDLVKFPSWSSASITNIYFRKEPQIVQSVSNSHDSIIRLEHQDGTVSELFNLHEPAALRDN